jgi:hypothetical protein
MTIRDRLRQQLTRLSLTVGACGGKFRLTFDREFKPLRSSSFLPVSCAC